MNKTYGDITGEARMNSQVMFFYGTQHMDMPVLTNQQGFIKISSVWTEDVV